MTETPAHGEQPPSPVISARARESLAPAVEQLFARFEAAAVPTRGEQPTAAAGRMEVTATPPQTVASGGVPSPGTGPLHVDHGVAAEPGMTAAASWACERWAECMPQRVWSDSECDSVLGVLDRPGPLTLTTADGFVFGIALGGVAHVQEGCAVHAYRLDLGEQMSDVLRSALEWYARNGWWPGGETHGQPVTVVPKAAATAAGRQQETAQAALATVVPGEAATAGEQEAAQAAPVTVVPGEAAAAGQQEAAQAAPVTVVPEAAATAGEQEAARTAPATVVPKAAATAGQEAHAFAPIVPVEAATANEEQEGASDRQSPVSVVPEAAATAGLEFAPREPVALMSEEAAALLRRRARKRLQRARARARAGHGAEGGASSDGSSEEARSGGEDAAPIHTIVDIARSQRAACRAVDSDGLSGGVTHESLRSVTVLRGPTGLVGRAASRSRAGDRVP